MMCVASKLTLILRGTILNWLIHCLVDPLVGHPAVHPLGPLGVPLEDHLLHQWIS